MSKSAEEYRIDNDSVVGFVRDCLAEVKHTGGATQLTTSSLWRVYSIWCEDGGFKAVGQIEFTKRMKTLGFEKAVRPSGGISTVCFLGVSFNDDSERWFREYEFLENIRLGKR
jgi:putative DNA primase/helicase